MCKIKVYIPGKVLVFNYIGKLVTKGTYAKMARGEMVRFIAENNIENPVEIQKFDRLGYSFRSDLSSDSEYVFERKIK